MLLWSACKKPVLKVPYYTDASFTPVWQLKPGLLDTLHRIGNFRLTDQHQKIITAHDIAGKISLNNFFFTSCAGICPRMNKNMQQVVAYFRQNEQVVFLSHSVNPERDSVAQLKAYAARNGITSPQWHLLTGDINTIYHMARKEYWVEEEEGLYADSTAFLHTEHMVLVDKNGHIRGLYNGTQALEMKRIIADIEALLKE